MIAADSEGRSPGFYSRYASARLRYPSPRTDPEGAVEALLDAARERRVDLIVPVTEEMVLLLSEARDRFIGVSALALPDQRRVRADAGQARDARARQGDGRSGTADRAGVDPSRGARGGCVTRLAGGREAPVGEHLP